MVFNLRQKTRMQIIILCKPSGIYNLSEYDRSKFKKKDYLNAQWKLFGRTHRIPLWRTNKHSSPVQIGKRQNTLTGNFSAKNDDVHMKPKNELRSQYNI